MDELLPALFKGNALSHAGHDRLLGRLAYFTGLSTEYIERANLRINGFRFAKELLRDQGLAVGILDARYTRDDMDDLDADPESDAADDAFAAAFVEYHYYEGGHMMYVNEPSRTALLADVRKFIQHRTAASQRKE